MINERVRKMSGDNLKSLKVGQIVSSMSRQAGGVFWVIKSLSKVLRDSGNFIIFTFGGKDNFSEEDLYGFEWGNVKLFLIIGPKSFGYQFGLLRALMNSTLNLIHIHGLWMYPSFVTQFWSQGHKPYVVSPHGMLDSWAVSNSLWKKRIACFLYEDKNLKRASCIHALCYSEYQAIRRFGLTNPVAVIPNGIELPDARNSKSLPPVWSSKLPKGAKVLLFLGRIHPKKGLINLVHAWRDIKNHELNAVKNWQLVIGGWDQDGHESEVRNLALELNLNESIHFVGPIFGADKIATLLHADAFVLPSFSEGLPMAILEAWAFYLPVVMTPQCNLPEGFVANAAIKIESDIASISIGILQLMNLSDIDRKEMGLCGRRLVENQFTWDFVGGEMERVYGWLLGHNKKPDCVLMD